MICTLDWRLPEWVFHAIFVTRASRGWPLSIVDAIRARSPPGATIYRQSQPRARNAAGRHWRSLVPLGIVPLGWCGSVRTLASRQVRRLRPDWPARAADRLADHPPARAGNGPGGAAAMKAKAPFGFRYQYLAAGVNTGNGWRDWQ